MREAVGRYLIIFLLNFAIFGHVQSATTPEHDWMTTPVCECNANGFRLISNHLLTGFEGKFAGHFTKITACEEPCTLNYGLLPCTGYFYEPNNNGKCTLFFHHDVNTNVQSSPNGTASLYVKCDQVSLEKCTGLTGRGLTGRASTGGNTVATTTLSSVPLSTVMATSKGEDPIFLLSSSTGIYQFNLSAFGQELVDNPGEAVAMDYWLKGSTIIWSMLYSEKIYMCNLTKNLQFPKMLACDDNGNHTVLVEHNISKPYGLAVDWIHGLMFWTDQGVHTINVMDLNTKQRKVLFSKDIDTPQSIAVDPSKGLIFWADQSKKTIVRASMDGNDRMTIVNSNFPYGIALDIFNQRVYWVDSDTKTFASVDYNGKNWRTILHSINIKYPFSLTIFDDKLYWADWSQDGVFVMAKFNGTGDRKLANVNYPYTVRVYHSAAQPELPNKCDQHSCGDGAICLPKGNSSMGLPYSCVCADVYKTEEEQNTKKCLPTTTTSTTTTTTTPTTTTSITTTTQRSGGAGNGTTVVTHLGATGVTESGVTDSEDITISCHISRKANRTQPFPGITNGTQVDLNECDNYLSVCHVNDSNLEKYRSQIECVTYIGGTVNCTYTDSWLRDTHCGPEFKNSSCEMMTINCSKEELVMTTDMGDDLFLLLSSNIGVYQYDLYANRMLGLAGNPIYANDMDYWLKGSKIIWSRWNSGKIYMCNLTKNLQFPKMIACDDNGNHTVLVEHNILYPAGLAVDWIHGLLFWTDYYLDTINVMDLNTKQSKVLFNKATVDPGTIAVDPSKGLIFWIQWRGADRTRTIQRASMDGNDRMTIANYSYPYGIALDIFNERVYWTHYDTKTIASVDYNGNDWRTILHYHTDIEPPISLAIFEEKLYWTDLSQSVFVMNKFNGTEVRKLISGVGNSNSVRVYQSAAQPELPNKCDQNSCGDGAICLPKGNSFDNEGKPQSRIGLPYSCVCADGYTTGKEPNTTKCLPTTTTSTTTTTTTPTTTTSITTTTQRLRDTAEDITISCHINRTKPFLGITNTTHVDLIECDNYLSVCHVNNSNLEKSRSQIECVPNVGITVNCTYTDSWLRDIHCGPEFNDSSCEMMTISCPKEELVVTTAKGEDLILLVATYDSIYQYDLSANRKLKIIDSPNNVYGMDYSLKDSTMIWSTYNLRNDKGMIYMCNLTKNLQFPKMIACDDNGNHTVLFEDSNSLPAGLTVDWIHGLLFWTDYYLDTIIVMDLSTKQRKVLFKDIGRPQTIAVDPSKSLIFWAHWSNGAIERASMDGNDRMAIAKFEKDNWRSIIALDIFNERVYWTYSKNIASVDYNGNDWRTILPSDTYMKYIYSLTIFEEKLYWTDRDQRGVLVINKFNGTEIRKLISVGDPITVRVYNSAVQPELPNKCDQHSCGNGAICLPKANSSMDLPYSCVCADGYKRGEESNMCVL